MWRGVQRSSHAIKRTATSALKRLVPTLAPALSRLSFVNSSRSFQTVATPPPQSFDLFDGIEWPKGEPKLSLDAKIAKLSEKYKPLACEILREAVRIPADYADTDPLCGTSNHEGPRLHYFRDMIVKCGAVERPEDVFFDRFGNIVWTVEDRDDGVPAADKKVIFYDGHTDTVYPLPDEWNRKIGGGIDVFNGLVDENKVDVDFLTTELGYLPPKEDWKHLLFGRGSADMLGGVVSQIIATKIMLELKSEGALKGVRVRSYGTVAEEDNDGGGPMFVRQHDLPNMPDWVPDVVLHTEGTGDTTQSACGIYIGQRGRMQIEVEIVGRSAHGSMPWMGLNPLEYGAQIITQAREQADARVSFLENSFLGGGSRTASLCSLSSPSNCAVPASFTFRFDRRLTVGETPEEALAAIAGLPAIAEARKEGLEVGVRIPHYSDETWTGFKPDNEEMYMGWMTPPEHQAVQTAHETWTRVVSDHLFCEEVAKEAPTTSIPKEPRIGRWIFSTDGVGFPITKEDKSFEVKPEKNWVETETHRYPAQIGIGIGFEQNTHKVGEFIDTRHFPAACAFVARFPSLYAARAAEDNEPKGTKYIPVVVGASVSDEEGTFQGAVDDIFYRVWRPSGEAKQMAVLLHGWAEHSGRYSHVARHLAREGTQVYALDHLGHGKSGGDRVIIGDFDAAVEDIHSLVKLGRNQTPDDLPLVVAGHSMGGLLTARYAQEHTEEVAGAAFMGAVLGNWDWAEASLATVPEGSEFIPDSAAAVEGMSRCETTQREYAEDPLVYHGLVKAPLIAAEAIALQKFRERVDRLTMPLLLLHGAEDPFVPYRNSVHAVTSTPSKDVTIKVYPGARHELVNETNKEEVLKDLGAFVTRVGQM